jgi:release factor glutamine methyltransferase
VAAGQRSWKLLDILAETSRFFASRGLENARLQAELLLASVLEVKRLDLYLQFERPLHTSEVDAYREYVRQRLERVPVQYITGLAAFRHLDLVVTPDVLIPRPETEILVDVALECLPERGRVLDLCSGSGAIALSLAHESAEAQVVATDISEAALVVAKKNGERCGLDGRVEWLCGDLFAPLGGIGPFDVVVANPPYVRLGDLADLEPEVRDHEPRLALDGGEDGLDYYRRIARAAADFILPGGYLLLEVGDGQSAEVEALLAQVGRFAEVQTRPDLNGVLRVVVARTSSSQRDRNDG